MIAPYAQAPFGPEHLKPYLQSLYGAPLRVIEVRPLPDGPLSTRQRLQVEVDVDGRRRRIVLEMFRPGLGGLHHMPDRARRVLESHAAAAALPRHARPLDVGVIRGGGLQSLGTADEFFRVAEDVPGRPYSEEVGRLAREAAPSSLDLARAEALCAWMASLHAQRAPSPSCYAHHLRERLARGFEAAEGLWEEERLRALEHRGVDARWALRGRGHRLRTIHGDLDPANVVFRAGTDFAGLGADGPWGDPAEDLLALTLAYAVAAWRARGRLEGALRALHDRVWHVYLDLTKDAEVLESAPPFLAARALSLTAAEPSEALRERLMRLAERGLEAGRYDPDRVEAWSAP